MSIIYRDDIHTYEGLTGPMKGQLYTSGTKFIHNFEPKKDWKSIAQKYCSVRTPDEVILDLAYKQNKSLEQVKVILGDREPNWEFVSEMWKSNNKEACDYGHDIHLTKEDIFAEMQSDGLEVFTNPVKDNIRYSIPLENLKNGIYPELIIWNDEFKICGTSDIVEVSGKKISVRDWKTNKELKFKGFKGEKLLPPISHLQNCNFELYTLQLSLYAYMLELKGYEVQELVLHYTRDNKDYPLVYRRDEIISMLNYSKPKEEFNIYNFI